MDRDALLAMRRRHRAHARAGTVDQAPDVRRVPAAHYVDAERFERECERIFHRLPLTVAFSAELRESGSYRALDAAGVPVLVTRDPDGAARAFLNVCRHRGAILVDEGVGRARRFACPYHGWGYDACGALRTIVNEREFGGLDKDAHGLVPLPVSERAGLVLVTLTPGDGLDADTFLAGYDAVLEAQGLADCFVVGRQRIEGPNWKIAFDGYLDFYHLPVLHRETFGPRMPNRALYDAFGPHQRMSFPLEGADETEEPSLAALCEGVWTVFPNLSLATDPGPIFMVSQLFPGAGPGESVTHQTFFSRVAPDARIEEKARRTMAFMQRVVRDEDYRMGERIQRSLRTGALEHVLFGRNEGGGQRFHAWVDALLETEDPELPALFERRVGPEVA